MATDAYIKFGGDQMASPIEGDSYDEDHYFWCELRSCSLFDITLDNKRGADSGSSSTPGQSSQPQYKEVTLRKRVDWASTSLFMCCCYAGDKKISKASGYPNGEIDQATVHVCKAAGENKIAFLVINYYHVLVTKFSIEMSGPEPAENISFQFQSADYSYQETDPVDGSEIGGLLTVHDMDNSQASADGSTTPGGGSPGGSGGGGGAGGPPPAGPGGSGAGNSGNGTPAPASPAESILFANFPGYAKKKAGTGIMPHT